jgi:peptidoglycan/LPS O-acetylase OafA/YrhL
MVTPRQLASPFPVTTSAPPAAAQSLPEDARLHGYQAGRLESLDLLRGIAAAAVLIYHSSNFLGFQLLPQSYLAVDLFFVLSGFVIAHNYDRRIASGMTTSQFMTQRIIRLYPCYGLALVVSFVLGSARLAREAGTIDVGGLALAGALNAVMLPAFNRPYHVTSLFPFNGASWSIFFELVANLFYCWVFRYLGRRSIAVIVLVSAVVLAVAANVHGTVDLGMRPGDFAFGVPRVFVSFFVGVAIRRYVPGTSSSRMNEIRLTLVSVVLVLAFVGTDLLPRRPPVVGDLLCVLLLMPVLVILASRIHVLGAARAISTWAGNASYPIYLLQAPFFLLFAALPQVLIHRRSTELTPWIGIALILTTTVTALVVDRYFELPIRGALKRRWQARRAATV